MGVMESLLLLCVMHRDVWSEAKAEMFLEIES